MRDAFDDGRRHRPPDRIARPGGPRGARLRRGPRGLRGAPARPPPDRSARGGRRHPRRGRPAPAARAGPPVRGAGLRRLRRAAGRAGHPRRRPRPRRAASRWPSATRWQPAAMPSPVPTTSPIGSAAAGEIVDLAQRAGDLPLELLGPPPSRRGAVREPAAGGGRPRDRRATSAAADALGDPLYTWYVPLWRAARAWAAARWTRRSARGPGRADRGARRQPEQRAARWPCSASWRPSRAATAIAAERCRAKRCSRSSPTPRGLLRARPPPTSRATGREAERTSAALGQRRPPRHRRRCRVTASGCAGWCSSVAGAALPGDARALVRSMARAALRPWPGRGRRGHRCVLPRQPSTASWPWRARLAGDVEATRHHVDDAVRAVVGDGGALLEALTALDGRAGAAPRRRARATRRAAEPLAERAAEVFDALGPRRRRCEAAARTALAGHPRCRPTVRPRAGGPTLLRDGDTWACDLGRRRPCA